MELLAADIGGTSSRFARFSISSLGELMLEQQIWLKTAEASSFEALLGELECSGLTTALAEFDRTVFALAGPIENGEYCSPPNISWKVDLRTVREHFGLKQPFLINDFLAQAYSACSPLGREARLMREGRADARSTIAVIGAGTGLGKAILAADGAGGYVGAPSEGGHAAFAPESEEELAFFRFLLERARGSYPTWEEVVSGRALSTIHEFLTGERLGPEEVAAQFGGDSLTLRWAARMYGRVCRNFALETLARGGVYIAGGVAAKNPLLLTHEAFNESFVDSAVHGELLQDIPLYLIDNQESGLWGAAYFGQQQRSTEWKESV